MNWFDGLFDIARNLRKLAPMSELDEVFAVCGAFGLLDAELRRDARALLLERLGMRLLDEPGLCLNFLERREIVTHRLAGLVPAGFDPEAMAQLVDYVTLAQARIVAAAEIDKDGVNSISEPVLTAILKDQGFRCDICGVPLRSGIARATNRFSGGSEPVYPMELDHSVPFYFGANDFLRLLCKPCNNLKWDRLGVQEDGLVMCSNHLRTRDRLMVRRRMVFWTLARKTECASAECRVTSNSSLLLVTRREPRGPLSYGNVQPYCLEHAPNAAWWIHEAEDTSEETAGA